MKTTQDTKRREKPALPFMENIYQALMQDDLAIGRFAVHSEYHTLAKIEWEGLISIRFDALSIAYTADCDFSRSRRDELVGLFMDNLIRHKWRLSHRNVLWVCATEFGKSDTAHCHILFSFQKLRDMKQETPDLDDFEDDADESFSHVCHLVGLPLWDVDLQWQPTYDNDRLASYFAKIEPGRGNYKHFVWSDSTFKWIKAR